jgi:hypothetical protein
VLAGPEDGGGAVAHADLAEDVANVNVEGALTEFTRISGAPEDAGNYLLVVYDSYILT